MGNQKTMVSKSAKKVWSEKKGITLVALVITVIIMLILAGVAISVLVNDGGLFDRTKQAKEMYESQAQAEAEQVEGLMNVLDYNLEKLNSKTAYDVTNIGDYVKYDAGTWNSGDFEKIIDSSGSGSIKPTLNSTVTDEESNNQQKPENQGEFGGFELNQSKNSNSTPYDSNYIPEMSGWRVWEKNDETKEVTLISAGHPETYYCGWTDTSAIEDMEILSKRDCSMYENDYAKSGSAKFLTGEEAVKWYNKQYNTNYNIIEKGEDTSTFLNVEFSKQEPISLLQIGTYYWLVSAYNDKGLYYVSSTDNRVNRYGDGRSRTTSRGLRVLVTLKADTLIKNDNATGQADSPWTLF